MSELLDVPDAHNQGYVEKKPDVAAMQDLLVYVTKGICAVTTQLATEGTSVSREVNHLISTNLFTTITNANFDKKAIVARILETLDKKQELLKLVQKKELLPKSCPLECRGRCVFGKGKGGGRTFHRG